MVGAPWLGQRKWAVNYGGVVDVVDRKPGFDALLCIDRSGLGLAKVGEDSLLDCHPC